MKVTLGHPGVTIDLEVDNHFRIQDWLLLRSLPVFGHFLETSWSFGDRRLWGLLLLSRRGDHEMRHLPCIKYQHLKLIEALFLRVGGS